MGYTDFEKEKLGKLFTYYHRKRNIKWKEIKEQIGHSTSYYEIGKGALKKDEIYDKYIKFYQLNFYQISNLEIELKKIIIDFTLTLECFDQDKCQMLFNQFVENYSKDKDNVLIHYYFKAFKSLYNYCIYGKYLTKEELEDYLLLLEVKYFESEIEIYLLDLLYATNNNHFGDLKALNRILKCTDRYENNPIIKNIYANEERGKTNFYSSLLMYDEMSNYWKSKGNNYRYVRMLMMKFVIYTNIDKSLAEKLIPDLLGYNVPIQLKRNINYNIAIFYYLNKKYEEAYPLFMENIIKYKTQRDWIFIGSICTRLGKEIPEEIEYCKPPIDYEVIRYFQMKRKQESKETLVGYIMNTLVRVVLIEIPYKYPLWEMFEVELMEIAKKDRKFQKTYLKYKQILKQNCKDA